MCKQRRWIYNRYSQDLLLLDCGHCSSCLQKRSNRQSNLIRLHGVNSGKVAIFTTLTYDRDSLPYIDFDEAVSYSSVSSPWYDPYYLLRVPFYRDFRLTHSRNSCNKRDYSERVELGSVGSLDNNFHETQLGFIRSVSDSDGKIHFSKGSYHRIGVLYYKDVQLFQKRLKQNVIRDLHITDKLDFFCCGEYGKDTQRPHFHVLIFCPAASARKILSVVAKSWPYGSKRRTKRYTEVARDASKYVAKYLNGHTFVPEFLQEYFPPKSSKSVLFGWTGQSLCKEDFERFVNTGNFTKDYGAGILSSGSSVTSVPVPSGVIERYFPRFTGFSRLTDAALVRIIERPASYNAFSKDFSLGSLGFGRFLSKLQCGYRRFTELFGIKSVDVYAQYFVRVWNSFKSFTLRSYDEFCNDMKIPLCWCYDNAFVALRFPSKYPLLRGYDLSGVVPQENPYVLRYDNKLSHYFEQRLKLDSENSRVYYDNDAWAGI